MIQLMKRPVFIAGLMFALATACHSQPRKSVLYGRDTLLFPLTVKEAVELYRLDYQPPTIYFSKRDSSELVLNIALKSGDTFDERQPREALFNRDITGYRYRFYTARHSADSIKRHLETTYRCSLKIIRDSLIREQNKATPVAPARLQQLFDIMPGHGYRTYATAQLSPLVWLGYATPPEHKNVKPYVMVFFMYNLSPIERRRLLNGPELLP